MEIEDWWVDGVNALIREILARCGKTFAVVQ